MNDVDSNKPKCDKKDYRLIKLDNDLEVLLVSSKNIGKDASKSAASLCVQVGSFADPNEAEGCAHFLEHMVFMGSKKYPEENFYDSFITSHGGGCNAFTEGEYTVYQFDVTSEYFADALDIFAQCFISPILSMSSSEREIKAIESEFKTAVNSDENRLQQLFCHGARKGHVLNKFSWGSYDSLHTVPLASGVDMQDVLLRFHATHYLPKFSKLVVLDVKGLDDIERDVRNCFQDWNPIKIDEECPMLINLDDIDEPFFKMARTEAYVIAPLPSMNDCLSNYKSSIPFDENSLGIIKRIVPIKKCHKVILRWIFPSDFPKYKKTTDKYIGHLVGHEGPGSLLSVLKEKNYSTGIVAGVSDSNFDSNSMFFVFEISIDLTQMGISNWIEVVSIVFQYINMLKLEGMQRWIFDEMKQMEAVRYAYLDEEDEDEFVEELAVKMHDEWRIDRKDLLSANFLEWDWDEKGTMDMLIGMSPQRCMIDVMSSAYSPLDDGNDDGWETEDSQDMSEEVDEDDEELDEDDEEFDDDNDDDDDEGDEDSEDEDDDEVDLTPDLMEKMYTGLPEYLKYILPPDSEVTTPVFEPYFETCFWCEKIPDSMLNFFTNGPKSVKFSLPPKNPYLPTELNVIASDNASIDDNNTKYPQEIYSENGLYVWHKIDKEFPTPKVAIWLRFISTHTTDSPESAVFLTLMGMLLKEALNETTYMASMAELYGEISTNDTGLEILVSGFSHKSMLLLETMILTYFSPGQYVLENNMNRLKEQLVRRYMNATMKAEKAADACRLNALKPSRYPYDVLLNTINTMSITPDSMIKYIKTFFSRSCVYMYAHGNIDKATVLQFIDTFKRLSLSSGLTLCIKHVPDQVITRIPQATAYIMPITPSNTNENNICLQAYYQYKEFDVMSSTYLDLLEQVLSEPFFNDLRTKQQLGYDVSCSSKDTYGVLGYCFEVSSTSSSSLS